MKKIILLVPLLIVVCLFGGSIAGTDYNLLPWALWRDAATYIDARDVIYFNATGDSFVNERGDTINGSLRIVGVLTVTDSIIGKGKWILGDSKTDYLSFVGYANTAFLPCTTDSLALGGASNRWDIYAADGDFSDSIKFASMAGSGRSTASDFSASDSVLGATITTTGNGKIGGTLNVVGRYLNTIAPITTDSLDIGSTSYVWANVHANDGYFGDSITASSLNIDDSISANGNTFYASRGQFAEWVRTSLMFINTSTDTGKLVMTDDAFTTTVDSIIYNGAIRCSDNVNITGILTVDSTMSIGGWGYTGEHIVIPEASLNTNAGLGLYSMINYSATAGKVFAGTYSRMLAMTTSQTNQSTMVGMESQFRLRGVNIGDGVHAGLWAYAEQSGTSVLSGNGTFDAISATVESESGFEVGPTEQITGITIDASINAGAQINASANYSAIYIKSNGKDWFTGIKITGVERDMVLSNGAIIDNVHADTLKVTETVFQIVGKALATEFVGPLTGLADSATVALGADVADSAAVSASTHAISGWNIGNGYGAGTACTADTITDASATTGSAVTITPYVIYTTPLTTTRENGRFIVTAPTAADSTILRTGGYGYLIKYAP